MGALGTTAIVVTLIRTVVDLDCAARVNVVKYPQVTESIVFIKLDGGTDICRCPYLVK